MSVNILELKQRAWHILHGVFMADILDMRVRAMQRLRGITPCPEIDRLINGLIDHERIADFNTHSVTFNNGCIIEAYSIHSVRVKRTTALYFDGAPSATCAVDCYTWLKDLNDTQRAINERAKCRS